MCALYGWLDCGKKLPHKLLNKLTQALANAAEERGTDAAGISYVRNGKITIYKRPKPAHKIRFKIPENATAVMGHTRLATQGDKHNNYNNTTFFGRSDKSFAFAHNGVLYNDKELRKSQKLPETQIKTDSYIGVQLIERYGRLNFDSLRKMAEDVLGSFVFTVLTEENTLYLVKGDNPLYLVHFERLGLYVYASTKSIMDKALEAVGMRSESHTVIKITEGEIISIDSNGLIDKSQFEPDTYSFFSPKSRARLPKYADWLGFEDEDYIDEAELLLSMCGCLGVDEDDVSLLLECGYSALEIEELLLDTDSFHNEVNELKCSCCIDEKEAVYG